MVIAALLAAFACPAQPALVEHYERPVLTTRVVACRRGRRVVLRRARLREPITGARSGRVITAVSGAARWVAWGELRYGGGRVTGTVRSRPIARGPERRLVVLRQREYRRRAPLGVALTSRRELAWLAARRVGVEGGVIARGGVSTLRLDDDRTLRWWDWRLETWRFHDLRPWRGGGCPVRSHFRVVAESAEVVASQGDYRFDRLPVDIIRACVRATGADPVIARADDPLFDDGVQVAGVSGPWVAVIHTEGTRSCFSATIEVIDPAAQRRGRSGSESVCTGPSSAPFGNPPLVVTAGGSPAWILSDEAGSRLFTTDGRVMVQLDAAGPGGLTDLVADGPAIRWSHDGEPRSAVLD